MAKLTVASGFAFDPSTISREFFGFSGDYETVKAEDDLWRVSFGTSGEIFIRSGNENLGYDEQGSPLDISDDLVSSGDISSFSFNLEGTGGEAGPAFVRIRGIDDVSGGEVHDAIVGGDSSASMSLLRHIFQHDDLLKGANGNDVLVGFSGADKIDGGGRADSLYGGHGADRVNGGAGQDFFDGGKGKDSLYGGGDHSTGDGRQDIFAFANGDSGKDVDHADRIHDFVSGTDLINLGATGADESNIQFTSEHGNTKITIDAHDGVDKMVLLVVGNDHVSIGDVVFDL